ncbi:MAG: NADH-quinone oxidoreductase subunit L [Parvularculaceae bacterium]|nr:NADH-quinone oxidoreductase subunit L [Parvularculaceae bacterium]
MEALVVLLPLFGAVLGMPLARIAGPRATEILTTALLGAAAAYAWWLFFDVTGFGGGTPHPRTIELATWFASGKFEAAWAVHLDSLSAVMLVVVNTVSFLVHLYSIGYMHEDEGRPRFFCYLSLFTFAMLTLVTADNFMQLFFGWEGVGLASYLLIGFWFKKKSANDAAIKAFVVNRVGDFGFALGIMCVFWVFGSVKFNDVFSAIQTNAAVVPLGMTEGGPIQSLHLSVFGVEWHALTIIAFLLFIGAMGKSAQFLLHTWLPDAMEGPTPVSALIHAATMVTAGVFLVCRSSAIFENAPDAAAFVTVIGAITAFFAATVGLFQNDIKKIIAYSTCSQLGYMFVAAGVGAYGAAMFHLFTHAFFKALLFLGAGSVIHGMHHEQDIKAMGGVRHYMPLTYLLMVIGTIAITGVGVPGLYLFGAPFGTAGFVSKDVIIEGAFAASEAGRAFGGFAFVMTLLAAVLTAFYSWRLILVTFNGKTRLPEEVKKHPHDVPVTMLAPISLLAVGALAAGVAFYPAFVGKKQEAFWNGAIYSAPTGAHGEASHADASHGAQHAVSADAAKIDNLDVNDAKAALKADAAGAGAGPDLHAQVGAKIDNLPADDLKTAAKTVAGDVTSSEKAHSGEHHVPAWVLWSPFVAMLIGASAAFYQYANPRPFRPGLLRPGGMIYEFFRNKWYFDELYDFLFVKPALWFGRFLWKEGDGKTIDGVGPDGIAATVAAGARRLVLMQTGYVYHYAFAFLIGVAALLTWVVAGGGQ